MGDEQLTIGEVADRSGVATSALRFYEREGLIVAGRTGGGQRRYPPDVLRRIAFVRVAQRVGLSLEAIREALATLPDGRTPTRRDWTRLSRRWQPALDEQLALLQGLRDQLDSCIGCGCLSLDTCALHNLGDKAAVRGPGPRYLLGDDPSGIADP